MTSPYLLADETVRTMAFALRHLPAICLDSERERRAAYWDACIRADDMLRLDAGALKRERTRRRLFGIVVNLAAVVAMSGRAAASGMEAISGSLADDLRSFLAVLLIVGLGCIGFCVVFWLLTNVSAALLKRPGRQVHIEPNAADEIWP